MATSSILFNESISELADYWLGAEARLGINGDYVGAPELVIRNGANQEMQRTFRKWDLDDSDGIDSLPREFSVSAADGVLTWSVEGGEGDPISHLRQPFEDVHKVVIRAGATGIGWFSFQRLEVRFYNDSLLVDSYMHSGSVEVDTRHNQAYAEAENMLEVYPAFECDEVHVNGEFQLFANEVESPDQLFGQILVYTSA